MKRHSFSQFVYKNMCIFCIARAATGLTNKHMRLYADAKDSFMKLHTIVRSHPQIIYQIAHCSELLHDIDQATEWCAVPGLSLPRGPFGEKERVFMFRFDRTQLDLSCSSMLNLWRVLVRDCIPGHFVIMQLSAVSSEVLPFVQPLC